MKGDGGGGGGGTRTKKKKKKSRKDITNPAYDYEKKKMEHSKTQFKSARIQLHLRALTSV